MKIIQVVYQNALSHSIKIAKLVKWNRFLGGNKDERFHEISVFFALAGALAGCGGPETSSIEIDMKQYPNYVENLNEANYSFGDKELQDPFWLGNIMYNESVMMMQKEGQTKISGNFSTPLKRLFLSVITLLKRIYRRNGLQSRGE